MTTDAVGPGRLVPAESDAIRSRGYWESVWIRFKRDKVAVVSGIFIMFMLVGAFAAPPIAKSILGHGPEEVFIGHDAVSVGLIPAAGPWLTVHREVGIDRPPYIKKVPQLFILGAADRLGRDEFLRLLYGARTTLEVALLSTFGIVLLGMLLGVMAGYFGGWIDGIIWRLAEVAMVFPVLLFIIALSATVGPRLDTLTLGGTFAPGVIKLALIFTIFGWFYPARILRAQTLSIRKKEYVDAARMIGANDARIIRSHLLPHLVAPITVYASLLVGAQVLAEAGLSYLQLGIQEPYPSWGNMLASATQYYSTRPLLIVWPGLSILLTVLAFNLLGDGLRDAFDPTSEGAASRAPRKIRRETRRRVAAARKAAPPRPRTPVTVAARSVAQSYRWRRRFAFGGMTLAVAGPLIWLGIRYTDSGNPENANGPTIADYAVSRDVPFTKPQQRQAHEVLKQFIATAVVRHDPGKAWSIAGPALKEDLTPADYAKGNLPIIPFPAGNKRGWGNWDDVVYSFKEGKTHTVGLQLRLFSRPDSTLAPITASVEVVQKKNGPWLVNYWMPELRAKHYSDTKVTKAKPKPNRNAKPAPTAEEAAPAGPVSGNWWMVPAGLLAAVILVPLLIAIALWYRSRRAERAHSRAG